jgi:hypothetical protein
MTIARIDNNREHLSGTRPESSGSVAADLLGPRPPQALQSCGPAVNAPLNPSASSAGEPTSRQIAPNQAGALESMMSQFSIYFDGRHYRYRGYRYDRVGDALAYARLMRSRHPEEGSSITPSFDSVVPSPSDSDRQLMHQLSISFEAGVYRFAGFRYDNLTDAVNYARTCRRRHPTSQCDVSNASSNPAAPQRGASPGEGT